MSDMLPRPKPRDPFKRALRAQLMAQAATTLVRRENSWSRFQRAWMRPALSLAAVALLLVAGTGKAAADSLPGDAVYPLKRVVEQVQLAFAIDETTRLRVLAEQADHRLAELAESITTRRPTTGAAQHEYADAIEQLTKQVDTVRAQQGVSEDKKNEAEDIVDAVHLKHSAVLQQLEQQRDPGDQGEQRDIERAKDESDKLHASGRPARTAEPSDQPERTRSPQPTRTANPSRTPESTRSGGETDQPERTQTPQPSRTPEPTRTGGGEQGERTATPTPSIRR